MLMLNDMHGVFRESEEQDDHYVDFQDEHDIHANKPERKNNLYYFELQLSGRGCISQ